MDGRVKPGHDYVRNGARYFLFSISLNQGRCAVLNI